MTQDIDVIVPCYRYGHYLETCVDSVLSQTDVDVRILILDDASPDHTPEVGAGLARRDKRVTFRRHAANKGHIATYNEGIEWASSTFLLLLSADDYVLPGALGRAVRMMAGSSDMGFAFGNAVVLHEDGSTEEVRPLGRRKGSRAMPGAEFIRISGARNIVPTPTAVVRTEVQKRLGGYRPELPHAGDMEMWLRLAADGSVGFVDEHQGVYRRHAANMSLGYYADNLVADLQQRRATLDMFFDGQLSALRDAPEIRRRLLRDLGNEVMAAAHGAFHHGHQDASEGLRRFALDVCPGMALSWPMAKYAIKRALGVRRWQALNSARNGVARWRTGASR